MSDCAHRWLATLNDDMETVLRWDCMMCGEEKAVADNDEVYEIRGRSQWGVYVKLYRDLHPVLLPDSPEYLNWVAHQEKVLKVKPPVDVVDDVE